MIPPGWQTRLALEETKPYFKALATFLQKEYAAQHPIYPARENVLRALEQVAYDQVKVVILGQDPYHGPGQAIGLSFAVPNDLQPKPPSLRNIFQEIASDLQVDMQGKDSDLGGWVQQGVLLLNTVLTVRAAQAFSHRNKGWESFTDQVIRELDKREDPVVFILWGSPARKKKDLLRSGRHPVIESAHPSPLSAMRGFMGSKPFSKTNDLLKKLGKAPIDWTRTRADY